VALTVGVPAAIVSVVQVAMPAVTVWAAHGEKVSPPTVNVTVPVAGVAPAGAVGATAAVNVTASEKVVLRSLDVTAVVVSASPTLCVMSGAVLGLKLAVPP
jgi:hypothetical protein